MQFVAFDLETTGLDTKNDDIIELGFALYDTRFPAPLTMHSFLIQPKVAISEEITGITGITQEHVDKFGVPLDEAIFALIKCIQNAEYAGPVKYLVGHNALDFDYPMLKNNCLRAGLELPQVTICDTKIDLPFEKTPKSTSLIYLAAEQGFLNPFPHRALFDAMTCAKLLSYFDVEKVLASSNYPLVEIRADVRFEQRDLAKKAGYGWDPERKIWVRKIRQDKLPQERQQRQFQVLQLS